MDGTGVPVVKKENGRSAGQDRRSTGPYSGSQVGMRVHPYDVDKEGYPSAIPIPPPTNRSHRECRRVWSSNLWGSLGTRLEPRTQEGRDRRRRRMDLESCGPCIFRRPFRLSISTTPASIFGKSRAKLYPNDEGKAKSLDEDPPEAPSGSRENRKTGWRTPFHRIRQLRTNKEDLHRGRLF